MLLEIVDDSDRPCAVGETGRVVVTNLHNFATPTIRQELGDLATVGAPCPCGRGLPVLSRIDGRVRDLLSLPDGRRVLPSIDEERITAAAPQIRQFQLALLAPGEVELRLVLSEPLTRGQKQALQRAFDDSLGHAFRYRIRPVERMSRRDSGKAQTLVP